MKENKKSFKEFVVEHKYQIITGAACITTGVVTFLLFKEVKKNESVKELQQTVEMIQEAMSEGMVQEAIATTTRKYNNRLDIIDRFKDKNNLRQNEKDKYNKALEEAAVFKRRLEAFHKVEKKYFIED